MPGIVSGGHWLRPRSGFFGDHVGVVGAAVVADEKALVLVRAGRLVDGRGALHRGVDRQVADIVLVEPELEFFLQRQRVKAARGGEGAVDQRLGHAVPGGVEEPDILAGIADIRREAAERAGLAGEERTEIDDRDLRRRRFRVLDAEFLEQVHCHPPPLRPDLEL